jgi:hypothetical protein
MLIRTLTISLFLVSAFFRPAEAHFVTGDGLLKNCTSTDKDRRLFCTGLIVGYYEMLTFLQANCGDDSEKTAGQIEDVVVKYLKEHPGEHSKPAASVSAIAISEAFKCRPRDDSFSARWPESSPQHPQQSRPAETPAGESKSER